MKIKKRAVTAFLWICAYMILIDLATNVAFKFPEDPRKGSASKLARFFEYGRSIEGKLARMTKETQDKSAPILTWGWILEPEIRYFSTVRDPLSHPTITVYGMSHSVLLAEDLAKVLAFSMIVLTRGSSGSRVSILSITPRSRTLLKAGG